MVGSITSLGIGSSLDLQGILDSLRKADEAGITKIENEKTELEARKNEFNAINAKFLSMKSDALTLSLSSNYLKRSSSISNSDVLSASVSDGADLGSHSMEISRLASHSSFLSAGMAESSYSVTTPNIQTATTGVSDPSTDIVLAANEEMTVTYGTGDDRITLTLNGGATGMTLDEITTNFKNIAENDAGGGDSFVSANVNQGDDGLYYLEFTPSNGGTGPDHRLMVTQPPAATAFTAQETVFSYAVGDGDPITISVPADTSLTGLAQLINDQTGNGGVTASVINTGATDAPYKLLLKSDNTGESGRIHMLSPLPALSMTEEHGGEFIMRGQNALDFSSPIVIRQIDGNTDFVFSEDNGSGYGSSITATIADGVYQDGDELAQAVETAMENASSANGFAVNYSVAFNSATQRLEIAQDGTLTALKMEWDNALSKAAPKLGFDTTEQIITPKASSLNAALTVDGIDYQRESNTRVSDIVSGISLTFSSVGSSTFSISQDTSGITKEIKELISTLNELAKEIDANDDYNEETNEWGTLAKTPSIRSAKERLLNLMGSELNVEGNVNSFYDLGFQVARDGTISLDETVLNAKVTSSFGDIETFLLGTDEITGMADQVNDLIKEFTKAQGLIQSESAAVDSRIQQINEDITLKTEQLDKRYDTMSAQFTALDQYMRQMQSQQNFITQMTESQKNDD